MKQSVPSLMKMAGEKSSLSELVVNGLEVKQLMTTVKPSLAI